jgi:2-hydroxy-6-oxonona-2,4-dienedioate hydrolase
MEARTFEIEGRPAKVWVGGQGVPILLLHGRWGGASLQWGPVLTALCEHALVIAPELPGIGEGSRGNPSGFAGYARWVVRVLDALHISAACVTGNSFGGALAWELAVQFPERCQRLVLVDGGPLPIGAFTRAILRLPPLKALLRALFRRNATLPRTLARAFARPGEVSTELREAISQSVQQIPSLVDTVLGPVTDAAVPRCPVLILWGEDDRLNRGDQIIGWILQRTQARVERIPAAGHVPQIEQPREFVQRLLAFAVGTTAAASASP